MWDLSSGERSRRFSLGPSLGFIACVAYSPAGNLLAYEDCHRRNILLDAQSGTRKVYLEGHNKRVSSFVFSSSGKYVASAGIDHQVGLWDVSPASSARRTADPDSAFGIKSVSMFEGHTAAASSVAFSPDEKSIVSGSLDHTAKVWDVAERKLQATYEAHTDAVNAVAYHPKESLIASGGLDQTVHLWEPRTGRRQRSFDANGNVYALAFSPDGTLLATGTNNNGGENVTLWDVKTGNHLGSVSLWNVRVEEVAFSPDGSTLAAGGWTGVIKLWNVADILR